MNCYNCYYFNEETKWCEYHHIKTSLHGSCSGIDGRCPHCGGKI